MATTAAAGSSIPWGKIIGAGASIYSGISALGAAEDSASLFEEQGALTRDDYFRQASLVREEGQRFRAKQTMQYISAGVEAVGTPLLVLRETLSKSMAKAGSLETTGINYEKLYNKKAKITKNEGQATMVADIMSATALFL